MAIITLNNNSLSSVTSLPAGVGGKVLQVVNATKSTETFTNSSSYADYLTASITPSSSSNKILVVCTGNGLRKDNTNAGIKLRITRGSTQLKIMEHNACYDGSSGNNRVGGTAISYLDSPSTTSATTYKLQIASPQSANVGIGDNQESTSTITLYEVSA